MVPQTHRLTPVLGLGPFWNLPKRHKSPFRGQSGHKVNITDSPPFRAEMKTAWELHFQALSSSWYYSTWVQEWIYLDLLQLQSFPLWHTFQDSDTSFFYSLKIAITIQEHLFETSIQTSKYYSNYFLKACTTSASLILTFCNITHNSTCLIMVQLVQDLVLLWTV